MTLLHCSPWQKPLCIQAVMHPGWIALLLGRTGPICPWSRLVRRAQSRSRRQAGFHDGLILKPISKLPQRAGDGRRPCRSIAAHAAPQQKAVIRDSCLVFRENPKGPVAGAEGARTAARGARCRPCRAIAAPWRATTREKEATGRLFPSPADLSPTGVDEVFVPSNGVITLNLNRLPAEKKTEKLQYQKGRDSCLVIREMHKPVLPVRGAVAAHAAP